ncbi:uncharacterized protein Bfra_009935, partial [Botrytis fragariae]
TRGGKQKYVAQNKSTFSSSSVVPQASNIFGATNREHTLSCSGAGQGSAAELQLSVVELLQQITVRTDNAQASSMVIIIRIPLEQLNLKAFRKPCATELIYAF